LWQGGGQILKGDGAHLGGAALAYLYERGFSPPKGAVSIGNGEMQPTNMADSMLHLHHTYKPLLRILDTAQLEYNSRKNQTDAFPLPDSALMQMQD